MLDKLPPICIVDAKKYLTDLSSPTRKIKKNFNNGLAFFIRLPNSAKVHIVTTANIVSSASLIYLEVHEDKGRWIRCQASVKSFFGGIDVAILELNDSENKAEFMNIAQQRALQIFSNSVSYQALQKLDLFLPVQTKERLMLCKPIFQGLADNYIQFSQIPNISLVYSAPNEAHIGSPCIVVIDQQPLILGIHQCIEKERGYGLPWLLLQVVLQADLENRTIKSIGSPLIQLQDLENSLDRTCNGLDGYEGGARIKKIWSQSRLAEKQVKEGDILLKVNGKQVSSSGSLYDETLCHSFRFSLMAFNAAMPDSIVELELGRPRRDGGVYGLEKYTINVINDRHIEDTLMHKDTCDYQIVVISGFQFFAVSRYRLAEHKNYAQPTNFFQIHLRNHSLDMCDQVVILGELPTIFEAEAYSKFSGRRVTQVDGKAVLNFETFKHAIDNNIASGSAGVTVTLVEIADEKTSFMVDNELGEDIYIKHQTPEENQRISREHKLPFQFFVTSAAAFQEERKRKTGDPEKKGLILS